MVQDDQAGLGHLGDEPLDARVLSDPRSDLLEEFLGDVDGPGLPSDLPGQDVSLVGLALGASAPRVPAPPFHLAERGGYRSSSRHSLASAEVCKSRMSPLKYTRDARGKQPRRATPRSPSGKRTL